MFRQSVLSVIMLLAWMPPRAAHAAGEDAADIASFLSAIGHLYSELDYEQAFNQIQRARQLPRGADDEVVLSLYEGIILYEMGKLPESSMAFRFALSLRSDANLPVEKPAPKVVSYFESTRQKVLVDKAPTLSNREPVVKGCPPSPVKALGRNLRAQQLWRLASMEQLLCTRGRLSPTVTSALSDLKGRMEAASSSYDRLLICQDIDKLSINLAVYPSTSDWRKAKASVPREIWTSEPDDPEIPLLADPSKPVSGGSKKSPPASVTSATGGAPSRFVPSALGEDEPRDVFGCQLAVAAQCERLMRRLLLMQDQSLSIDPRARFLFRRELFLLGRRIRGARTRAELDAASRDIDARSREYSRYE